MGCYSGAKAEPGSLQSSSTSTRHCMFCHQAQPPNQKLPASTASPIPLPPSVPSLVHPSPKHPHTSHLSPLPSTGGTVPLLGKSTPLFPANRGPPFNSHLPREPGNPNSPCSQLQPINPLALQPSQLFCDYQHLSKSQEEGHCSHVCAHNHLLL